MQNFFVSKEKLLKDKLKQLSKTNLNFDDSLNIVDVVLLINKILSD